MKTALFASVWIFANSLLIRLIGNPFAECRNFPTINFCYWELLVTGTIVAIAIMVAIGKTHQIANRLGYWLGDIVTLRSKSNVPGNALVVVALIFIINAITYGPPSSTQVDWSQASYDAKVASKNIMESPQTEAVKSVFASVVNYSSEVIIGKKIITTSKSESSIIAPPIPRYYRGWRPIILAIVSILIAIPVWIIGRRDDLIKLIRDYVKKEGPTSDSGSTVVGERPSTKKKSGLLRHVKNIIDHIFGEFISDGLSKIIK